MHAIKTILTTEALFSDDGTKRYLLRKEWDNKKHKLAIIMLAPSSSSGIELDTSTQLVINNVTRLGFGSVEILNLSAMMNDFSLKKATPDDKENIDTILNSSKNADVIVYAPGVGKSKNKTFQQLQEAILRKLAPYEAKLHCLADTDGGSKFQHPLSPCVREWHLLPFKITDLINKEKTPEKNQEPSQKENNKSQ